MFWLFWFLAATIVLLLFLWLPAPNARRAMATLTRKSYAHRGLHNTDAGIPENSLPAFEHAVKNGYGIELDVQLTADHCLVVFHDDDTQRMCGKQLIVSQSTMDELWQLRLGNTKERIPLLEDVLRVVGGRVPLIIEIKYQKRYPQLCKALMVQLEGYRGKYCIESFHPFVVRWLYKHVPQVPRGILSMNYAKEEKWRGDPVYFAAKYLLTNVLCRPHFIAYCHQDRHNLGFWACRRLFGAPTVAWTVRSEEEQQGLGEDYDAIIFENYLPPPEYTLQ
ncbi:MAG: glycerophosphodiester phosphodiesterase [Angelakisella sp.]|nr:glycerophosphodiester phosphodiesterase [Angelakisella sp.]